MSLEELLLDKKYSAIHLRATNFGHLEISGSINGVETLLLLDTGAASTVIDVAFAEQHALELLDTSIRGGGVGTSELMIHQIDNVDLILNGFQLPNMTIYAADLYHVRQSLLEKGETNLPCGVVGADILSHHKAVIDYANLVLYLQ